MFDVQPGRLGGELSFATVPQIRRQTATLLSSLPLDLSGVTRADSAGVALLLELRRRHGQPLPVTGLPSQLASLIEFFNLGAMLIAPPAKDAA